MLTTALQDAELDVAVLGAPREVGAADKEEAVVDGEALGGVEPEAAGLLSGYVGLARKP